MFFKSICNQDLLYIISLFLISSFFINVNAIADDIMSQEPFEIWQENSVISEIEGSKEKSKNQELTNSQSQKVKQEDFLFSKADAIGLYDSTNGGFEANIWNDSNLADIAYLIKIAPLENSSSTLNNLLKKAILTTAAPPDSASHASLSYLDIKLDFLIARGHYENVYELSRLLKDKERSEALSNGMIDYLLIYNQYKKICSNRSKFLSQQLNDLYFISFCNAMAANKLTLDLNISLMKEDNDNYDEEYLSLLSEIIYSDKITVKNLKEINLINLNILQNYNVDIDEYITDISPIKFKLFYFLNSKKNNLKKISITEELVQKGLVDHKYLTEVYQSIDLNDTKYGGDEDTALIERIKAFKDMRKTSSQSELVKKMPKFVNLFSAHGLLNAASLMIYDKISIISPKSEYAKFTPDICLILILNNDAEKCNEWANIINYNSNKLELSKANFYLSLVNGKSINDTDLNQLINDQALSEKQKNIIVKYAELKSGLNNINYWKTPNELNKVSSITANIKLHNYFNSLKNQLGEKIILLSILHGDDNFNENDEFTLFLIIDGLFGINEVYARDYILEYFTKFNL